MLVPLPLTDNRARCVTAAMAKRWVAVHDGAGMGLMMHGQAWVVETDASGILNNGRIFIQEGGCGGEDEVCSRFIAGLSPS